MQTKPLLAGLGLSLLLAGCSTLSDGQTVAEYCSDPERAGEGLCQLKVDINGVETQLSQTNLSVSEARRLAESAAEAAAAAQASADAAQGSADRAMSVANQALSMSDLSCETRVLNQTDTGTCRDGYTLMGCSQTRYTYRAGGLSFLREVNDEQCRFNSQVLEMHVRCCTAGPGLPPDDATLMDADS
ncbi:MAG: hypothetical protein ACON4C_10875 [Henriciella sp.]|jgi:hypothetical protein